MSTSAWDMNFATGDLRRARTALIVTGILCLIGGAAAIAVPIVASVTMTLFIGWVLVAMGGVMLVHALRERSSHGALRVLDAVLALLVGLYLVILPLSGTVTLTFLLGVWFFGSGVMQLAAAWGRRGAPGATLQGLGGALSIVLGILLVADLPSSAAWAIGLLVGINLVFWGLRTLSAAGLLARSAGASEPADGGRSSSVSRSGG